MNKEKFPDESDLYERGVTAKRTPKKRLSTEGAWCADCKIVMVPSGGACFHCPKCGGSNTRCGG